MNTQKGRILSYMLMIHLIFVSMTIPVIAQDTTAPITSFTFGVPDYFDGTNHWVISTTENILVATDNPGGVGVNYLHCELWYDTGTSGWVEYIAETVYDNNGDFYFSDLNPAVGIIEIQVNDIIPYDGEHQIRYYAEDYDGNTESEKIQYVLTDHNPPLSTIEVGDPKYGENDEYITTSTPLTLTAFDVGDTPQCGIKCIHYRYDDGAFIEVLGATITFTIPSDGEQTLQYYCIDNLGNVEALHSKIFYVEGESEPAEEIEAVIEDVIEMDIPQGLEQSLSTKLTNAILLIENGNTNAAISMLNAFINQVEAQRGKKLTDEEADLLITSVQAIIDQLNT